MKFLESSKDSELMDESWLTSFGLMEADTIDPRSVSPFGFFSLTEEKDTLDAQSNEHEDKRLRCE